MNDDDDLLMSEEEMDDDNASETSNESLEKDWLAGFTDKQLEKLHSKRPTTNDAEKNRRIAAVREVLMPFATDDEHKRFRQFFSPGNISSMLGGGSISTLALSLTDLSTFVQNVIDPNHCQFTGKNIAGIINSTASQIPKNIQNLTDFIVNKGPDGKTRLQRFLDAGFLEASISSLFFTTRNKFNDYSTLLEVELLGGNPSLQLEVELLGENPSLLQQLQTLDFYQTRKLSFQPQSIANILSQSGPTLKENIDELRKLVATEEGKKKLTAFFDAGFSPSNLSSIWTHAGKHLKSQIDVLYNDLVLAKTDNGELLLPQLIKQIEASKKKGSRDIDPYSTLSALLQNKKGKLKEAINALSGQLLSQTQPTPYQRLMEAGFSSSNINTMIRGNILPLEESCHTLCTALLDSRDDSGKSLFDHLTDANYSPNNIALILLACGNKIEDKIRPIWKLVTPRQAEITLEPPELIFLDSTDKVLQKAGFKPSQIAYLLTPTRDEMDLSRRIELLIDLVDRPFMWDEDGLPQWELDPDDPTQTILLTHASKFEQLGGAGFSPSNLSGILGNSGEDFEENLNLILGLIQLRPVQDGLGHDIWDDDPAHPGQKIRRKCSQLQLLKEGGFSVDNIAGMLRRSGPNLKKNIGELIKLVTRQPMLGRDGKPLLDDNGHPCFFESTPLQFLTEGENKRQSFTPTNIAGICVQMGPYADILLPGMLRLVERKPVLNGQGELEIVDGYPKYLPSILDRLTANAGAYGIRARNISGFLHKYVKARFSDAIDQLEACANNPALPFPDMKEGDEIVETGLPLEAILGGVKSYNKAKRILANVGENERPQFEAACRESLGLQNDEPIEGKLVVAIKGLKINTAPFFVDSGENAYYVYKNEKKELQIRVISKKQRGDQDAAVGQAVNFAVQSLSPTPQKNTRKRKAVSSAPGEGSRRGAVPIMGPVTTAFEQSALASQGQIVREVADRFNLLLPMYVDMMENWQSIRGLHECGIQTLFRSDQRLQQACLERTTKPEDWARVVWTVFGLYARTRSINTNHFQFKIRYDESDLEHIVELHQAFGFTKEEEPGDRLLYGESMASIVQSARELNQFILLNSGKNGLRIGGVTIGEKHIVRLEPVNGGWKLSDPNGQPGADEGRKATLGLLEEASVIGALELGLTSHQIECQLLSGHPSLEDPLPELDVINDWDFLVYNPEAQRALNIAKPNEFMRSVAPLISEPMEQWQAPLLKDKPLMVDQLFHPTHVMIQLEDAVLENAERIYKKHPKTTLWLKMDAKGKIQTVKPKGAILPKNFSAKVLLVGHGRSEGNALAPIKSLGGQAVEPLMKNTLSVCKELSLSPTLLKLIGCYTYRESGLSMSSFSDKAQQITETEGMPLLVDGYAGWLKANEKGHLIAIDPQTKQEQRARLVKKRLGQRSVFALIEKDFKRANQLRKALLENTLGMNREEKAAELEALIGQSAKPFTPTTRFDKLYFLEEIKASQMAVFATDHNSPELFYLPGNQRASYALPHDLQRGDVFSLQPGRQNVQSQPSLSSIAWQRSPDLHTEMKAILAAFYANDLPKATSQVGKQYVDVMYLGQHNEKHLFVQYDPHELPTIVQVPAEQEIKESLIKRRSYSFKTTLRPPLSNSAVKTTNKVTKL